MYHVELPVLSDFNLLGVSEGAVCNDIATTSSTLLTKHQISSDQVPFRMETHVRFHTVEYLDGIRREIQSVSEYNIHGIIKPRSFLARKFSLQADKDIEEHQLNREQTYPLNDE
jgi:hypothetical protein